MPYRNPVAPLPVVVLQPVVVPRLPGLPRREVAGLAVSNLEEPVRPVLPSFLVLDIYGVHAQTLHQIRGLYKIRLDRQPIMRRASPVWNMLSFSETCENAGTGEVAQSMEQRLEKQVEELSRIIGGFEKAVREITREVGRISGGRVNGGDWRSLK